MEKAKALYLQLEQAADEHERVDLLHALTFEFLNTDLDRYETLLQQAKELANKLNYERGIMENYNALGRLKFKRADFDAALEAFTKVNELAKKLGIAHAEAVSSDSMGMVWWNRGNYDMALQHSTAAFKILEALPGQQAYKGMCLNNIGNSHERRGEWDKAEDCYRRSLEYLLQAASPRILPVVRGNLAVLLARRGNQVEAIENYKSGLAEFEERHHKYGVALTHNNIAKSYYLIKDYAMAMEHYLKAVKLLKQIDAKKIEAEAHIGLAEVYMQFGGFDNALDEISKARKILQEISYPNGEGMALYTLGEIHLKMQKTAEAIAYLEQGYKLVTEKGILSEQEKFRKLLYETYTHTGDNDSATRLA